MNNNKQKNKTETTVKPLREGVQKNNQEKPNPVIQKSDIAKPPAAAPSNVVHNMSNKQSSVEWAIDKITMICALYNRKEISVETFEWYHNDIATKAKAMHQEEHKKTYNQGLMSNFQNFDDYYNETFGGNNEEL